MEAKTLVSSAVRAEMPSVAKPAIVQFVPPSEERKSPLKPVPAKRIGEAACVPPTAKAVNSAVA